MATNSKKTTRPSGPEGKGLKVVSRTESFYRAGLCFGREPITVPYTQLTEAQALAIREEPSLISVEVDIEATETGTGEA